MKAFVTGGAGFIGSNLADLLLLRGYEVVVYDNFSTGQKQFVEHNLEKENYELVEADVLDYERMASAMKGADIIFHFQANADVRGGMNNTQIDVEQNIIGTHNVLEGMRINNIKKIVFSSSATIYGEPEKIPTPEDISPVQTSIYGASKYSAEALIQAYCEYFDMQNWIFRFVSFMGPRYTHGVVFDFMKKLRDNPSELYILGDGTQRKSYLHVKDGIEAILLAVQRANAKTNIYNLGNREYINVTNLADLVCETLGLKNVKFTYAGGIRGWKGDTPFVNLDIQRISKLGWNPKYSVKDTIVDTVKYLSDNPEILDVRN